MAPDSTTQIRPPLGVDLAALRERAGLSIRAAAQRVGIHHSTLQRYEAGERVVPTEVLEQLDSLYDAPSIREGILDFMTRSEGATHAELRREFTTVRERAVIDDLISEGTLIERGLPRIDSRNRAFLRAGVVVASVAERPEREYSWIETGEQLRWARQARYKRTPTQADREQWDKAHPAEVVAVRKRYGPEAQPRRKIIEVDAIPVSVLAQRLGVSESTYCGWERTAPPPGRIDAIAEALIRPVVGAPLRDLVKGARWTSAKLAQRCGCSVSTAHGWVAGISEVSETFRQRYLMAIEQMRAQIELRGMRIGFTLEECVAQHPGMSIRAVAGAFRYEAGVSHVDDDFVIDLIMIGAAMGDFRVIREERIDCLGRSRELSYVYPTQALLDRVNSKSSLPAAG